MFEKIKFRQRAAYFGLGFGAMLLGLHGVAAEPASKGTQLLQKVDAAIAKPKDQMFEFAMTIHDPKGLRNINFRVAMKEERRRVDFLAPGDVKDMRVLTLPGDKMYVFLPAFNRVRRVAAHTRKQGFMGSSYGHDEMSITSYAKFFSGKVVGETDKVWKVLATKRKGINFPYPVVRFEILKDVLQPSRIEYLSDSGKVVKTEERSAYTCNAQDFCNPEKMSMVDHTRSDLRSDMVRVRWQANTGVPDSYFSVRSLQRGS